MTVAAVVGIEPTHRGVKVHSLTTWLHRYICLSSCVSPQELLSFYHQICIMSRYILDKNKKYFKIITFR